MGVYNTILVPCPNCENIVKFQTKSGSKLLTEYNIKNVPKIELKGIYGETEYCSQCKTKIKIIDPEKKKVNGMEFVREGYEYE